MVAGKGVRKQHAFSAKKGVLLPLLTERGSQGVFPEPPCALPVHEVGTCSRFSKDRFAWKLFPELFQGRLADAVWGNIDEERPEVPVGPRGSYHCQAHSSFCDRRQPCDCAFGPTPLRPHQVLLRHAEWLHPSLVVIQDQLNGHVVSLALFAVGGSRPHMSISGCFLII